MRVVMVLFLKVGGDKGIVTTPIVWTITTAERNHRNLEKNRRKDENKIA